MQIECRSPFALGAATTCSPTPPLSELGAAHGRSVAQAVLRRLIQRDVVVTVSRLGTFPLA